MKKTPNGRKLAGKDTRKDCATKEPDSEDLEAVKNELEARLKRLESAHSNGSSEVYKFVFFFLMGVILTALIHPRIASTFDQASKQPLNRVADKASDNSYNMHVEQIDELEDADETAKEQNVVDQDAKEQWNSEWNDSENIKTSVNEKFNKIEKQKEDRKGENKTKSGANGQINTEKKLEYPDAVDISMKTNDVNLKPEKVEDLMIEEYEDINSDTMPISFSPYVEDKEDANLNPDNNGEPRRVELFSANIDEITKDTTFGAETAEKKERNNDSERNFKKPVKSKKTLQSKTPPKAGSKSKKKESVPKDDKNIPKDDKNIPKEIRDFKPTYQKDLTPKKVFIDGRRIPPMELLPQKPNNSSVKVWMFEEFLSEEECDGLMRVHDKHVQEQSKEDPILCFDSIATLRKHLKSAKRRLQVTPNVFTPGTTCVNASFSGQLKQWLKSNWSYSTAFYPGESRFASIYEQRVKQAMGLNPENGGKFQITSYPKGIGYKSHTDCTENSDDKRDRMATVLVYLDTVSEGGETDFPELGIWARPRKGRALLWNSMSPEGDCEPMSIHKANKVIKGQKYILQRWYYYKSFYSLGKRPPEPPLPERKPGQPRVSCDEYEHGSCRWYDEWNFEHMIEYERQKYTLV